MFKPEQDIPVQAPVIIVRRPPVMGHTARKPVADLHQEHTSMLLCDQVLPLLGSAVRIQILQFLGGDEENVLGKVLYRFWIFVPHLVLHVLDDLEYLTDRVHQGIQAALLLCDHTFPVPLVHITGVQVIQLLIPADCVHVGVKAFTGFKAVLLKGHTFPFGKGVDNLQGLAGKTQHIKVHGPLRAVQVIVKTAAALHEQGGGNPLQVHFPSHLFLERVTYVFDCVLCLPDGKPGVIVFR